VIARSSKQRKARQSNRETAADELGALEVEIAERQKRKTTHQDKARRFAETARQARAEQVREFQRGADEDAAIQRLRRQRERVVDRRIADADPVTHETIRRLQDARVHASEHLDLDLQRDREHLADLLRSGIVPDANAVLPNQAPAETPRFMASLERRVKRGDFAESFSQQVDAALTAVRELQVRGNGGDPETALRRILAELPERCDCGFSFNLNIERAA
jgi:hypothetical protein